MATLGPNALDLTALEAMLGPHLAADQEVKLVVGISRLVLPVANKP
jgi:hypothetical protein